VLQRRRDTGTWALPGGFSEWGEQIEETLAREIREETGYAIREVVRVVGIYSHPRRDPRLHSIAVVVEVRVAIEQAEPPPNPAEVMEVRAFSVEELPHDLGYDTRELIADWRRSVATLLR
jgi:8-oxo-dGTP diphosphatase